MYADITIKAHCHHPAEVESILLQHNAEYKGLDAQKDTFYGVDYGKLKLRQGTIENVLIHYNRIWAGEAKQTEVMMYLKNPGSATIEAVCGGLEVISELRKLRKFYFIDNVKFHIDQVEGHGQFFEIEAIDLDGSVGTKTLKQQCSYYKELLQIDDEDLVHDSYIDL
ncbi:CYTH domain-containing protein [Pontibacter sp. BT310]|uniref:CYTH domain-containing protein n=1 Tax=Pontibacter populi TaxID=890055 RepID=A0ABS6XA42_9BACT|nr:MULTISPECIES: CYTH domain-containing protein [Pontibacter]MBJ6118006.1 CYTH domain-containing protein [Pontibacter sp. BT310]MBR0570433.1 CYTH domain-containing protein [Microvirga sp. STS03]MBW3364859.1 CYTH domain-containing protein [Pontibacter populi]